MRSSLIAFLFSACALTACESQQDIMNFIDSCKKGSPKTSICVEKGLQFFEKQDFVSSNFLFNLVLDEHYDDASLIDIGTCLWGSLLCAAILENEEQFKTRFPQAFSFFIDPPNLSYTSKNPNTENIILLAANTEWKSRNNNEKKPDPEVKFANPNEKITISECINRVKGVATALKFGIAFVKKGYYAFVLNAFVDTLQEKCNNCCRSGAFWTTCLSPIVTTLNKWKLLGIPDDPAWD